MPWLTVQRCSRSLIYCCSVSSNSSISNLQASNSTCVVQCCGKNCYLVCEIFITVQSRQKLVKTGCYLLEAKQKWQTTSRSAMEVRGRRVRRKGSRAWCLQGGRKTLHTTQETGLSTERGAAGVAYTEEHGKTHNTNRSAGRKTIDAREVPKRSLPLVRRIKAYL